MRAYQVKIHIVKLHVFSTWDAVSKSLRLALLYIPTSKLPRKGVVTQGETDNVSGGESCGKERVSIKLMIDPYAWNRVGLLASVLEGAIVTV